MANPFLNPIRLNSGYLNGGGGADPGKSVNTSGLPGTSYGGLLGKIIIVDDIEASRLSLTSTGTLRAGAYMLVQTKLTSTASPIRGTACFWDTNANSGFAKRIVTPDISATVIGDFAGIYTDAPAKGNYSWVQISGLATLLCKTSSVSSNLIGDLCIFTGLTTNTFDGIADATDFFTSAGKFKQVVGSWEEVPVADGLKLAFMKSNTARIFGL